MENKRSVLKFLASMTAAILISGAGANWAGAGWREYIAGISYAFYAAGVFYSIQAVADVFITSYERLAEARAIVYRSMAGIQQPAPQAVSAASDSAVPGVSKAFLGDFLRACSMDKKTGAEYLPAVRLWGDGSAERRQAEAITAYFVSHDWAQAAEGNRPAKFVNGWGSGSAGRVLGVYRSMSYGETPSPTAESPEIA